MAVVAVFAQVLAFPFVPLDDPVLITQNPHVLAGITAEGLGWAFTTSKHGHHPMPLAWLSLMLDSQLYGTWAGGFHLTNLLLHVCSTLLLFGLMRRMTGATWRSALVAGLFALHPLAVEPVAWATCRNYVLSTLGMFLMLCSYVGFARRGGVGRYLLTALFLVLGLMAKPSLVTLPLVLLLLDYWPLERIRFTRFGDDQATVARHRRFPVRSLGAVVIEKIPLLAISAVTCAVTYIMFRSGDSGSGQHITFRLRAANAVVSYIRYIGKLFWPSDLAPIYQHPNLHGGTPWETWQIAGSAVLLVAITVLVVGLLRHRYLIFGWLWFLGSLVPYIGIVQTGNQAMADRYAYVPSIGLFIVIVWGSTAFAQLLRPASLLALRVAGLTVAVAVVACGVVSLRQAQLWGNSQALIEHTLNISPNYPFLYNNLGVFFQRRGRSGDLDRAIVNFRKTLEVRSDFVPAHFNLGRALLIKQQRKEGLKHVQLALQYDPKHASAYAFLGSVYLLSSQLDKAEIVLRKALELEPNHIEALVDLGHVMGITDRMDDAVSHFHQALALSPQNSGAHFKLGVALQMQGRNREAIDHYRQALASGPSRAEAHSNLGMLLGGEAANEHYLKAISINPKYFEARLNLANALAAQGKLEEAVGRYEQVLRLAPQSAQAHYGLGTTLVAQGQVGRGVGHLRKTLGWDRNWHQPYATLARILATSRDASLRDPDEAIRLGRKAVHLTEERDPQALEILAAAYASAGQFEGAVTTARQGLELARHHKNADLEKRIAEQLAGYMQARPYVDVSGVTGKQHGNVVD